MDDMTLMTDGKGDSKNVNNDVFKMRSASVVFAKTDTKRDLVSKSEAHNDFYNVSEAKKQVIHREPSPVFGSAKKVTFTELEIKRNVSPGPLKYDPARAYRNISQIVSRRRS